MGMWRGIGWGVVVGLMACTRSGPATIGFHAVRTDASGRIVPWYGSGPDEGYDQVVRLTWRFWQGMRTCPNGVPYYLQHQVWTEGEEDARGLGGDQISMALSSWNLLHGYLGDPAVKADMVRMADHWLDHGMTAPGLLWANVPYPYNSELHSGRYDGNMRSGVGYVEPDKAASFGAELVMLYKVTENPRYRDAAIGIADTLVARIQAGDATHSPWPYRVHAATGAVHQEGGRAATYTTNWTGALRLFSDLADLGVGNPAAYRDAASQVMAWLRAHPCRTQVWGPFFEDIPTGTATDSEINADTLAATILEHPEWDLGGAVQARAQLDWSLRTLGNPSYRAFGVMPVDEQTAYRFPGNSHSARHGATELLYAERTGDRTREDAAIRQLNWATYMVGLDGRNQYLTDGVWLTDGYGDYIRHYLRAMALRPELAPVDQNHLLSCGGTLQTITYSDTEIRFTTFEAGSVTLLKLGAWHPTTIQGGSMDWDPTHKVLRVTAQARTIVLGR
jgi:hypothetical protein